MREHWLRAKGAELFSDREIFVLHEMKTREQNRNDKQTEIERFDWFIERIQTRARGF